MSRARLVSLVVALLVSACSTSSSDSGSAAAPANADGGAGPCAVSRNDEVRQLLAPSCVACHGPNTNKPFFATIEAFEDLLVYEPRLVTPNDPEGSQLVKLLEERAEGTYKQMPIVGDSFSKMSASGKTKITLAQVKDWIAHLPPPGPRRTSPSPDAPTTRRLTAEEMVMTLRRNLGLEEAGLHATKDVNLVLRGSDTAWSAGESTGANSMSLFEALGGPSTLAMRPREKALTPSALQLLVQISQDWCGRAVAIPKNPAIFKYATADAKSTTDAAAIKKNIGYLHLRFLGEVAPVAVVDNLFTNVFVPYEANGANVAWTAVCADLLRHPQWLTL